MEAIHDYVTIASFVQKLGGFRKEALIRRMAKEGEIEATKKGKAWLIDCNGKRAMALLREALQAERKAQERERVELEPERLRLENAGLNGRIAELEEAIASRNGRIAELEDGSDKLRKRIAELEQRLAVAEAEKNAFLTALQTLAGQNQGADPERPSKTPSKPSESMFDRWTVARRENPRATFQAVAEELGVEEEELRRAVRRERNQRRKKAEDF